MGANLSTQERIAQYCRNGDHKALQRDLAELQRNDSAFRSNRAHYLEATDDQGNTPLTLAAARGHLQCVRLLLGVGANVHHMNRKPDGGSALHEAVAHKHEAVVELLLRHRASPFTENSKGYTAMDIACSRANVPLLRRLEQCAPYAGWVLLKVPQYAGLGAGWQRRWVVVSHRYPNPATPADRRRTHCVFLAYKSVASSKPASRLWLDGALAQRVHNPKAEARLQLWSGGTPRVAQAGITLHPNHEKPTSVYYTGGHVGAGGQQQGCTFYLRPDDGSPQSSAALHKLIEIVNNRGFLPNGAAAAAAVASPLSSPSAPGTPTSGGGAVFRPQLPPAQAGPLFTHLPGVGVTAVAGAPGTWGAYPLLDGGGSSGSMGGGTESDEAIARRLQEEYDAEVARQMSQGQEPAAAGPASAPPPPSAPAAPPSAPVAPAAPARAPDYLTGAAFYPRVNHAGPEPLQPAAAGSGGFPGSTPGTPGPGAAGPQPLGRPSAPPALLDLDYPLPELPLAVGVAALGASGSGGVPAARPTHLPISVSGRHVSAPRLQDDARPADAPAAPPSRASSEPGLATASSAAAGGATQPPASPSDDSTVCVFCMDAPATAGVLHGESVHKCLCRDCAVHLKESNVQACPMCREPVQAFIMRVF